ncbi:MAG: hypothetical protein JXM79_08770 [Sedimentisphaerales bacterium]|nr:hypothetical protein [Sedimentisphaerales bacterium]
MCRKLSYLFSFVLVFGLVASVASGLDLKVNFMLEGGDIPPGYLPDYRKVFGSEVDSPFQYGWDRDVTADARERNNAVAPDQRYDTLIHLQKGADAIWEIEVPNGNYTIFMVCGDAGYTDQTNTMDVEGVIAVDPDGQAGNFDEFELIVTVADGRLTIKPAPGSSNSKICFVDIMGVELKKAYGPIPSDGALIEETWVAMGWTPGESAVSHDVYMGEDLDAVTNADNTSDVFIGNQTTTELMVGFPGFPYPEGLVPGTTYYWRIDEVEADGVTIYKGDVWSFSIPPKTAYEPDPADCAEFVDETNVTLKWTPGYGAKLHTVYFGDDYDTVNNAVGGSMQGTTSYKPGALEQEKVYYWRVDEFDAAQTYKGDVWCFTTPGAVGNASPANGASDVAMTGTVLTWTPSASAASHAVYFGTDKDAVRAADSSSPEYKGSVALGAESYDLGKLVWHTTYYWRVDEVGQGKTVKGPVWTFVTAAFIAVDDFESYTDNDLEGEAIWQSWVDGYDNPSNGSQAGYLTPPYAEQTTVHGGNQSMPLIFDNSPTAAAYSEATLTLSYPRDWTEEGVSELSLWFFGNPLNAAEPLYLSVANSAGTPVTLVNEDPDIATKGGWTQWVIPLPDLAAQGLDLTNVNSITVGLGTKGVMATQGGTGTVFFDDIALYR